MSDEINVLSRTQIIVVEPSSAAIALINAGPQGATGLTGATGPQGPPGILPMQVVLIAPNMTASTSALNNPAATFSSLNDLYRRMVDLRGLTKVRIQGCIANIPVNANKMRIQYHTGGNLNVGSADAGWTELCTTVGSHTNATPFYTPEMTVPSGAQIQVCMIRCGIYDGDGAADPTITQCILNFYA